MEMEDNPLMSSASVEWYTPPDLFAVLDSEYHFDLDPCATFESRKCARFFDEKRDGLKQAWAPCVAFMNPPYGRTIGKWVAKAASEARSGATVVALLPARTDTKWWHEYVQPLLNAPTIEERDRVVFLEGRVRFGVPGDPTGENQNGAPFPSAIVVFRPPGYKPTT